MKTSFQVMLTLVAALHATTAAPEPPAPGQNAYLPPKEPGYQYSKPPVTFTYPTQRPTYTTPVTRPPYTQPTYPTPPTRPPYTPPVYTTPPTYTTPPVYTRPTYTTRPPIYTPPPSTRPPIYTPPPSTRPPIYTPPPSTRPPVYTPPPSTPYYPTTPRPDYGLPGGNVPTYVKPSYGPPTPPPTHGHEEHHHHHHEPGMPFDFNYAVRETDSRGALNDYSHNAASNGDAVNGEYRVLLPDGRVQVVRYTADWATGYHAQVSYEGNVNPYDNNKISNPTSY